MPDVLIIGGGVIGLTAAWEISNAGLSVSVVDQQQVGREASWAGAGMIPPGDPAGSAGIRALTSLSSRLWPELSAILRERTGIDNGYRRCGGLALLPDDGGSLTDFARQYQEAGTEATVVTDDELVHCEPLLSGSVMSAVFLPAMAQVRNPWHLRALAQGCRDRGVEILEGTPVYGLARTATRILAAETSRGMIHAETVIVTAGAWSTSLLASVGASIEVKPIRGQILLLRTSGPRLRRVVEVGPRYLVPRDDGRLLVGSTEEDVGFQKSTTAEGIRGLLELANSVVPTTASACVETCWSGLRPCALRGRPYVGRFPEFDNLFLATGHFRAGLTNSPGTALILRDMILRTAPAVDPRDFSPQL